MFNELWDARVAQASENAARAKRSVGDTQKKIDGLLEREDSSGRKG
ncbi:hypothetical protein [Alloyangia pacifica]|nr:hypothetical protein [Alloyangia pacifica]MCA0994269.1 hypothetical protein [Alloyangia pacifica]